MRDVYHTRGVSAVLLLGAVVGAVDTDILSPQVRFEASHC